MKLAITNDDETFLLKAFMEYFKYRTHETHSSLTYPVLPVLLKVSEVGVCPLHHVFIFTTYIFINLGRLLAENLCYGYMISCSFFSGIS